MELHIPNDPYPLYYTIPPEHDETAVLFNSSPLSSPLSSPTPLYILNGDMSTMNGDLISPIIAAPLSPLPSPPFPLSLDPTETLSPSLASPVQSMTPYLLSSSSSAPAPLDRSERLRVKVTKQNNAEITGVPTKDTVVRLHINDCDIESKESSAGI
jgi:hypothetical protein